MLWQVYTFLILISFALTVYTLSRKEDKSSAGLLLITAILLSAVALYSFDVTYVECENQIGYMNVTADNVTQLTNNLNCKELSYDYSPLGYLLSGIAVIIFILFLVQMFSALKKTGTYDR